MGASVKARRRSGAEKASERLAVRVELLGEGVEGVWVTLVPVRSRDALSVQVAAGDAFRGFLASLIHDEKHLARRLAAPPD